MKVYLALPSRYPKAHESYLQKIIDFLKGNKDIKLTADFNWINSNKDNNDKDYFEEDAQAIEDSEFVIAEISYPSSGVGFQIAYALTKKKKVLCLYRGNLNKTVSKFIKSLPEDHTKIVKYNSENLNQVLEDYFSTTKPYKLHKFNFIISEKIKDYLSWLGNDPSQSISERLRFLVEKKIIDVDAEYQQEIFKK